MAFPQLPKLPVEPPAKTSRGIPSSPAKPGEGRKRHGLPSKPGGGTFSQEALGATENLREDSDALRNLFRAPRSNQGRSQSSGGMLLEIPKKRRLHWRDWFRRGGKEPPETSPDSQEDSTPDASTFFMGGGPHKKQKTHPRCYARPQMPMSRRGAYRMYEGGARKEDANMGQLKNSLGGTKGRRGGHQYPVNALGALKPGGGAPDFNGGASRNNNRPWEGAQASLNALTPPSPSSTCKKKKGGSVGPRRAREEPSKGCRRLLTPGSRWNLPTDLEESGHPCQSTGRTEPPPWNALPLGAPLRCPPLGDKDGGMGGCHGTE